MGDWRERLHIPMSLAEYELLPFDPGWKQEYWDGQLHLTPRLITAVVKLELEPHPVNSAYPLRPVTPEDREQLLAGYLAAFADTVHFLGWKQQKIIEHARQDLDIFFAGKRGAPVLAASQVATARAGATQAERVIGAALINQGHVDSPLLYLLFVLPEYHRQGIGRAMIAAAINQLYADGERILRSQYDLGNHESRAWHNRMGFVEELDLLVHPLLYREVKTELWRHEKLNHLQPAEVEALLRRRDELKAQCEQVEALMDRLEFAALDSRRGIKW